ncbi:hypothetical protein T11_447 [Trichinella zimbabwensis]|uniref:Uncharacterized protein n=1 Tax=Trichinella zimbabwensis TaxID=268475 RepID=A0A0V1HM59_9BILA|nr:hypothetical protein T11_447 [Trichinella zimbabwensis]
MATVAINENMDKQQFTIAPSAQRSPSSIDYCFSSILAGACIVVGFNRAAPAASAQRPQLSVSQAPVPPQLIRSGLAIMPDKVPDTQLMPRPWTVSFAVRDTPKHLAFRELAETRNF